MKVAYKDSVAARVEKRISELPNNVVLRKDIDDIAEYRQVSRAIKKLIDKKFLIRIGNGVYAKAKRSKYANVAVPIKSINKVFGEALDRLQVQFQVSESDMLYQMKSTTQVTAKNSVRLKSRCRRRLACGKAKLSFEKNINAK